VRRIEVKTAVRRSANGFFLTRNEFEKASKHGDEWVLVQLVLSPKSILTRRVVPEDIEGARYIESAVLRTLIPNDTETFRWMDCGRVSPADETWKQLEIRLDSTWCADLTVIEREQQVRRSRI
jgi:hypothetical protein